MKFKKRLESEEMGLQITSMADIFTILLVFLLKSYATGAVSLSPAQGTMLPEAHAAEAAVEALKVEITREAVMIEGKPATDVRAAFETERKRQLLIARSNSDVKVDPRILVVSDKRVPYSKIKLVLADAATQGYTDFKLAVVKGD